MDPVLTWGALLLLLIFTAGTFLPVLPGIPLMAAVIIGYGWLEGFHQVRAWLIILSLLFAAASFLLDYLAAPYFAKRSGASKAGFFGALIGGIAGILFLGPLGLILGPFLGALLGELIWGKSLHEASRSGFFSLLGFLIGNMLKLLLAIILLVSFSIQVIF